MERTSLFTVAASTIIAARVLTTAWTDAWSGFGAALLVLAALAAFAYHAWPLSTGRGYMYALPSGGGVTGRLAALDKLHDEGRIRREEYLRERRRLLRGP